MSIEVYYPIALAAGLSACGSGKTIPAIAPIVSAAIPSALRTAALNQQMAENEAKLGMLYAPFASGPTVFAEASDTTINTAVKGLFQSTYNKLSGGTATGFFAAALEDVDSRASTEGRTMGGNSSCAGSRDYTPSLGSIPAANIFTSKPACKKLFSGSGDQSGTGSGLAYGEYTENGSDTRTIWLHLRQKTNGVDSSDRFGYIAKVGGADKAIAEQNADIMFLESFPSVPRYGFYRLSGNPSQNTFELTLASTTSSATNPASGGTSSHMGCGIRMRSNGTYIRVAGTYTSTGSCGGGDTITNYCMRASDLTTVADSECASITFSYTAMTHSTIDSTTRTAIESAIQFTAATLTDL
jgi:hypothetical protein